ncbi:MAG: NYN domain-containing protein [Nocardioidaceae bacterium]|nr:NYN domain-containing protein [Nocardioidaceae bacterium]
MRRVLVVDAANVVGATPNGWWNDRAGAALKLHDQLLTADVIHDDVVLVLEGQAKAAVRPGKDAHVRTVHAPRDGDAAIVKAAQQAAESGAEVTVVTADRALAARVAGVGAAVMSPSWLLDHLH